MDIGSLTPFPCAEAQADHRSLPERLRAAVNSAGARRGHARRTKQCYGAWAARYGKFAGGDRAAMQVETATRFLTSVVDGEDCAFSTQKQALNALAFFFKHVCGVEDPVFGGRLKKTGTRIPVVLSKEETQELFAKLDAPPEVVRKSDGRYGLAARLQYGAGLRLQLLTLAILPCDSWEPPSADPHAWWCGRGGFNPRSYPIRLGLMRRGRKPLDNSKGL